MLGPEFAAQPAAFRLVMLGALANSYTTMLYPCLSAHGLARWGIAAFGAGSSVAAAAFWATSDCTAMAATVAVRVMRAGAVAARVGRRCRPAMVQDSPGFV